MATWDAVQMMLGKIWTRLEVIDKLAEAQGKLCQRLDELEKALGRLDPKANASEAKIPALTAVYDPITQGVKLVTMDQYERYYPKVPQPSYVAMYNPKTQSVELMFEKHYLESDFCKQDMKARRPRPIPEYTCVYDPATQEAKLELWDKYVQKHHPPQPSFGAKYNPSKKSVDLVFWRNYQHGGGYKVLSVADFFDF
jgi:hypothetical protein